MAVLQVIRADARAATRAKCRLTPLASLNRAVVGALKPICLQALLLASRFGTATPKSDCLIVSAFVNEPMGISVAGRLTVDALRSAGLTVHQHSLRPVFERGGWGRGRLPFDGGGVWLLHANAPEALTTFMKIRPRYWLNKYRIGYWAYELLPAPQLWRQISGLFHEIWVPSRFVADGLFGIRTPVRVMGHPVTRDSSRKGDLQRFANRSSFTVLCASDLRSSLARKNVLGAIAIYRRAFPTSSTKAQLLVKVHQTRQYPTVFAEILGAVCDRPDIQIMTDELDQKAMSLLVSSCDLFLSPHRSEGFGLLLAEAFMAGRLALATAWSGNMDYMKDLEPLLISARETNVDDPYGVYRGGLSSKWAEPDLDDGARKLAAIAKSSPEWRIQLSRAAQLNLLAMRSNWSYSSLRAQPFCQYL